MVLVALSYEVSDGEFTTPVNTSITVTSVNDPATFGGDSSGVVTEDHDGQLAGTVTATGTLTVSDIDSSEEFQAATIEGQYGTFDIDSSGSWTYTLDSDFAITGEFEGTDPVITDPIVVYSIMARRIRFPLILTRMG